MSINYYYYYYYYIIKTYESKISIIQLYNLAEIMKLKNKYTIF